MLDDESGKTGRQLDVVEEGRFVVRLQADPWNYRRPQGLDDLLFCLRAAGSYSSTVILVGNHRPGATSRSFSTCIWCSDKSPNLDSGQDTISLTQK